jgi:hypothetical protein
MWNGFVWLRIGTSHDNEPSGSVNGEGFPD